MSQRSIISPILIVAETEQKDLSMEQVSSRPKMKPGRHPGSYINALPAIFISGCTFSQAKQRICVQQKSSVLLFRGIKIQDTDTGGWEGNRRK